MVDLSPDEIGKVKHGPFYRIRHVHEQVLIVQVRIVGLVPGFHDLTEGRKGYAHEPEQLAFEATDTVTVLRNAGNKAGHGLDEALVATAAFLRHHEAVAFCDVCELLYDFLLIECITLDEQEVFMDYTFY